MAEGIIIAAIVGYFAARFGYGRGLRAGAARSFMILALRNEEAEWLLKTTAIRIATGESTKNTTKWLKETINP